MNPYVLGVDVWEGSLDIDEDVLWSGGVRFVIIRINDMDGGHHLDKNFANQWKQAERFVRWPYFVYNPWVSGEKNFAFLESIMPEDAKHVSIDVEVVKPGYSPQDYSREVGVLLDMARKKWSVDIYTGAWFLPYLSRWFSSVDYWMALYPNAFYPSKVTYLPWSSLKEQLLVTEWYPGRAPGRCRLWQISGDRLVPPGCAGRPIDINVWNGTEQELAEYAGMTGWKGEPSWQEQLVSWARRQADPYTGPGPTA